jgi:predicted ATP-dependent Lon-type protease
MREFTTLISDHIDQKAAEAFPGLVVRKDLLRRVRSAYGVPMFVIEFLLERFSQERRAESSLHGLSRGRSAPHPALSRRERGNREVLRQH